MSLLMNLTRIDNALAQMPERLKSVQTRLEDLYNQMEAAKAELGKPFPQDAELMKKSARLSELDALLNISENSPPEQAAPEPDRMVSKSARPSVLDQLKTPPQYGNSDRLKKPERGAR